MSLFLLVLMALSSVAMAQQVPNPYVPVTRVLRAKGYQLGVYTDYFKTTKTVDVDGKSQSLPEGYSFNRLQAEVMGQYGATNDLQFGVGLRYRRNQAESLDTNGDSVAASSAGVQSVFANVAFAFEQVGQLQYTLEGTFRYIPYQNEEIGPSDDPKKLILGDSGNEVSGGLGLTYLAKNNNYFTLRGGFRRPGSDLSDELYWQAEGAMAWRHVALIAGVNGVSSMNNDPYEDKPEDRPNLNAQTSLYNSENREWIAPYAGANFAIGDKWRVELRGSQVINGTSTDLGTAFGINLIRRVDKSAARIADSKFKTYDLETTITKVSPKKEYVVIDKGIADDFNKGMRIDFFEFDYIGGNVLVASGVIVKTKSDTSIVKITQRFNLKKEIKEGLIGRTSLK